MTLFEFENEGMNRAYKWWLENKHLAYVDMYEVLEGMSVTLGIDDTALVKKFEARERLEKNIETLKREDIKQIVQEYEYTCESTAVKIDYGDLCNLIDKVVRMTRESTR